MAHKKVVTGRSYPSIYNVDMTVGMRRSGDDNAWNNYDAAFYSNKRDDVMLVQYLLKRIYQKKQIADPPLTHGNVNPADLKVDGYWGPKTQSCIEQFQLSLARTGSTISTDGCVDPERGAVSSVSQTGYTINFLNRYLWRLYPELAPDITIDPECPPELKQKVGNGLGV